DGPHQRRRVALVAGAQLDPDRVAASNRHAAVRRMGHAGAPAGGDDGLKRQEVAAPGERRLRRRGRNVVVGRALDAGVDGRAHRTGADPPGRANVLDLPGRLDPKLTLDQPRAVDQLPARQQVDETHVVAGAEDVTILLDSDRAAEQAALVESVEDLLDGIL